MGQVMMFMVRSLFWLGLVYSTMDWSTIGSNQTQMAQDVSSQTQSAMTNALSATGSICSSNLQACALVFSQTQNLASSLSETGAAQPAQPVLIPAVPKSVPQSADKTKPSKPSATRQPTGMAKAEKVKTAHLDQGLQKASAQKVLPD